MGNANPAGIGESGVTVEPLLTLFSMVLNSNDINLEGRSKHHRT